MPGFRGNQAWTPGVWEFQAQLRWEKGTFDTAMPARVEGLLIFDEKPAVEYLALLNSSCFLERIAEQSTRRPTVSNGQNRYII